ncbi:MAG: ABC transporter permease [Bacteroidales bacterium]|nr:ABC transporter permease [Bacteroidales bacterium]
MKPAVDFQAMSLPFHIARRYLFAHKSHHAINIISLISVIGVMVSSMALVTVLSVFNGFEDLITGLYGVFDPDLKITGREGKTFVPDSLLLASLRADADVRVVSETLEENVLVRYGDLQDIPVMKGVDADYVRLTGLDTLMYSGFYSVAEESETGLPDAVLGMNVAVTLQMGLRQMLPLQVYMLRRQVQVSFNPEQAVRRASLHSSGIYAIEEESDGYILVPLGFMRDLLEAPGAVTALDVQLQPGAGAKAVQQRLAAVWGDAYVIQTRYEQKALVYKIMRYEKWAGFMILAFILLIASFNVISSLSMLMLEKKEDARTLSALGADSRFIRRIFYAEGVLIAFSGAVAGLMLGALCCYLQQTFGIVKLANAQSFIIEAYPVRMKAADFAWILLAVGLIGGLTSYWPVHRFFKKVQPVEEIRE